MSRLRSKPNQFIIQNFRSWAGKHYISLNQLNFLFGGNSSGKSSILAAISLLKQSLSGGELRTPIPLRLLGSGSDIQLGPIEKQAHQSARLDSHSDERGLIGFGIKLNDVHHVANIVSQSFDYGVFDEDEYEQVEDHFDKERAGWVEFFVKKFKTIELLTFYDSVSGDLRGYDIKIGPFAFLKVEWCDDDTLAVRICDEEGFWKPIFDYTGAEFVSNASIIEKIDRCSLDLNEALKNSWSKYRQKLDDFYMGKTKISGLLEDYKEATKRFEENPENEHFKRRKEKLSSMIDELMAEANQAYNLTDEQEDVPYEIRLASELNSPFKNIFNWSDFENFLADIKENCEFSLDRTSMMNRMSAGLKFTQARRIPSHSGMSAKNNPKMDMIALACTFVFPEMYRVEQLTYEIMRRYAHMFRSVVQIGPHREMPNRIGVIDAYKQVSTVGKSAENLLNLLYQNYEDDRRLKEINNWLKKLEIGYALKVTYNPEYSVLKLTLVDDKGLEVQLNDVGYGISQILPIVVQTVLSKNRLLTVEQPELHIHPRLQANLADLFVWSAENANNKFIIETHSEHLILRLQRRQREETGEPAGPKKNQVDGVKTLELPQELRTTNWQSIPKSITISVIEKKESSEISEIQINSKGGFTGQGPGGFFEERFSEKGII